MTSGIMHLKTNGKVLCSSGRRSGMACDPASFDREPRKCVRCTSYREKQIAIATRRASQKEA